MQTLRCQQVVLASMRVPLTLQSDLHATVDSLTVVLTRDRTVDGVEKWREMRGRLAGAAGRDFAGRAPHGPELGE